MRSPTKKVVSSFPLIDKVAAAEDIARRGGSFNEVIRKLRELRVADFAKLMYTLPKEEQYPHLSAILPKMPSTAIQKGYTGRAGEDLVPEIAWFFRIVFNRIPPKRNDVKFLDFGCGYGRLIRMMYYVTDPENIYGVDAWQVSVDRALESGTRATIRLSEKAPEEFHVDGERFDTVTSFSVFTHLSEEAALAAFRAIRKCIRDDGYFILTIRPREMWEWRDGQFNTSEAPEFLAQHDARGFAHKPDFAHYGTTSMSLAYIDAIPNWQRVHHETRDYQQAVVLKPV